MANKRYKLTFDLYDGTKKSVVFEVPQGEPGQPGPVGPRGEQGDAATDEQVAKALYEYMKNNEISVGSTATIGEVKLLSDKWVGSGNLYSQVVSIDGVTENSQVDLTPSVEQLVVFYEKDLTFVTENENGVVTVYAIGQKPANDYTVQVTITEVDV